MIPKLNIEALRPDRCFLLLSYISATFVELPCDEIDVFVAQMGLTPAADRIGQNLRVYDAHDRTRALADVPPRQRNDAFHSDPQSGAVMDPTFEPGRLIDSLFDRPVVGSPGRDDLAAIEDGFAVPKPAMSDPLATSLGLDDGDSSGAKHDVVDV